MARFEEYCPISLAVDVLGDRWSPLVLRELLLGSTRFNDIHRGVPRMSRTLLSQRLRDLQRHGIVDHVDGEYRLTEAGADLQDVVFGLGTWAARWRFGDPTTEKLDGQWLVWRLHQHTDPDRAPARRTVVEIHLTGDGGGRWWLVFEDGSSTICQDDSGYEVDLLVRGDNLAMHRWLLQRATWQEVVDSGAVVLEGPQTLARSFPRWFGTNPVTDAVASARSLAR